MARLPAEVAALQLILLTGCRKSEIVGLHRSEVRGRRLLLHDAKTGPRTVWLGSGHRFCGAQMLNIEVLAHRN